MSVTLNHFLWVSLLLFAVGVFGALNRRNLVVLLISVELMLNAVNLTFVAFSQFYSLEAGGVAAFFVMTISAAEAGVGLALIVALCRQFKISDLNTLQTQKDGDL